MNVRELIELLEDFEPETEVRLAHQPSYPLQFDVHGVASSLDVCKDELDESEEIIWITEGNHPRDDASPYAPMELWDVARRS